MLLVTLSLTACGDKAPAISCGEGTELVGDECLPVSDGDADVDADTDGDADADADSDTDADPPEVAAILGFAKVTEGCDQWSAGVTIAYEDINEGSGKKEMIVDTRPGSPWASDIVLVPAGHAFAYTGNRSAECLGGASGVEETTVIEAGQMLTVYADGVNVEWGIELWEEGVDYSATEAMVAFQDDTSADYAESILEGYPLTVVAQVADTPPVFLVEADAGVHAAELCVDLVAETRITYAIPNNE